MAGALNLLVGGALAFAVLSAVNDSGDVVKGGAAADQTTSACTATPVGGTPDFSYAWTKVSGDTITINSAAAAATTFTATGLGSGETRVALFKCTVTDALGAVVATRNITVTIQRA